MTATAVDPRGPILERLLEMDSETRAQAVQELTDDQALGLLYDWTESGRRKQQSPEGDWVVWLILAGRGWGKTRTGAELVVKWVEEQPWQPIDDPEKGFRIALVAETKRDAREVIALGPAGILAVSRPWNKPKYEPSKGLITWPSGAFGFLYSGEEPDQLRGPAFHKAWVDEWAKYQYPVETMDNLELALRQGDHPQMVITTTPRPLPMLKEKVAESLEPNSDVILTRGHTNENRENLASSYVRRVIKKYENTRLGRQELSAEILDDVEGGFWTRDIIERNRLKKTADLPEMLRIAIAIDPATTSGIDSNETGMVAGGKGVDGKLYLFHDLSGQFSPKGWARRAVSNYDKFQADAIIGEKNNGGDMVESTIRTIDTEERVKFRTVWASRGKHIRAEPVASKHEQNKIKFVGHFPKLEDQLLFFTPEGYEGIESPDRAEAFIWLAWFLILGSKGGDYDDDDWASSAR